MINNKSKVKYNYVFVPDVAAANVVRVKQYVLVQHGYDSSISLLKHQIEKRGLTMIIVNTNELEKADGLLTCCCVLIK